VRRRRRLAVAENAIRRILGEPPLVPAGRTTFPISLAHERDIAQPVLLKLGPATVHASASLELTVIRAPHPEAAPPPVEARVRGIDVGISRAQWVVGFGSSMTTLSQIVAPGNPIAAGLAFAVGSAWAEWRWRQRGD
jgi:hypothetical protein